MNQIELLALTIPAPIIYLAYFRYTAKEDESRWKWLTLGLIIGGLMGLMAGTIEGWFKNTFDLTILEWVVILAPLVEEPLKAVYPWFGFWKTKEPIRAQENGLASGLGFAIVENYGYALLAFAAGGPQAALMSIALRSVSAALYHGASASLVGRAITQGKIVIVWLLALMGIHALNNYLQIVLPWEWALGFSMAIGIMTFVFSEWYLKIRLKQEERTGTTEKDSEGY